MSELHSEDETNKVQLDKLRSSIDELDEQLQAMINKRAEYALAIANIKTHMLEQNPESVESLQTFYRPEREAYVLQQVIKRNAGPVQDEDMARLFREIMSVCLAMEEPLKIAYLGPEGTFTHAAVLKHFGESVTTLPFAAIDEVFREVEAHAVSYGIVPVENSTEGAINHTLDSFIESRVRICGEVEQRIHHNLLVSKTTLTDRITRVYSHQQSFAQCRKWLDAHYPNVERIAVNSNAEAARRIQGEWNSAAIAGEMAAKLYNLEVLHPSIEDRPDNSTRFLVIGNEAVLPSGQDKTSIVVSMKNAPGALHELLDPFHRYAIDLTRIETRPGIDRWSYVFFIDFKGHQQQNNVEKALKEVAGKASDLKVLGSYPVAVL